MGSEVERIELRPWHTPTVSTAFVSATPRAAATTPALLLGDERPALRLVGAGASRAQTPNPLDDPFENGNFTGEHQTRAWHLDLRSQASVGALMDLLVRYRDVVVVDNIHIGTSNKAGVMPTRTLFFPIQSRPEYAARRHALMEEVHARFGLRRYQGYDTHGLIIPLDSCNEHKIDLDALQASVAAGQVDDAMVAEIFRSQGPLPPPVSPRNPYISGADERLNAKDPRCNMAGLRPLRRTVVFG